MGLVSLDHVTIYRITIESKHLKKKLLKKIKSKVLIKMGKTNKRHNPTEKSYFK